MSINNEKNIDILKEYINSIPKTNIDNKTLFNDYKKDKKIKKNIIENNLKLVIKIANLYKGSGVDIMDLIAEGNLGLIKAIELYDVDKNIEFSTYAVPWIKKYISEGISKNKGLISIPSHVMEKIHQIKKIITKQENDNIDINFIAKELKINKENVYDLLTIMNGSIQLDKEIDNDNGDTIGDLISDDINKTPDNICKNNAQKELLYKVIKGLDKKELKFLEMRFGLNDKNIKSLADISKELKMSKPIILEYEKRILKKIKGLNNIELLK